MVFTPPFSERGIALSHIFAIILGIPHLEAVKEETLKPSSRANKILLDRTSRASLLLLRLYMVTGVLFYFGLRLYVSTYVHKNVMFEVISSK